jgi:hypothetical protein
MLLRFAARDVSILAISVGFWWLLAERSSGVGVLADFAGVAAGLMLGVCAYLLHEWGHLLGALATRSRLKVAQSLRAAFIFSFDSRENSLAQFLVMSFSGFAATAAVVWAFYVYLPEGLLATRVARGGVLLLAFVGLVLEVPLVLFALRKRTIPSQASVAVQGPAL